VISGDFFAPLLRGIEREAMDSGYSLLIHSTQLDRKGLFKRVLAEHNTDGLIVFTDSLMKPVRRLSTIYFPTVLMHRTLHDLNIPFVTIENKQGVHQLMDHLIRCITRGELRIYGEESHEDAKSPQSCGYRGSF
jgi:DNA-binding LacI/PurR family transcriptional regulator